MKTGEVWRFPLASNQSCLFRVVLRVADLGLSARAPMSWVNGCVLIQVAPPGEREFDPKALQVNGLFLLDKPRIAAKQGFERVGSHSVSLGDIEFPCWLIEESQKGILFCRGEHTTVVGRADAPAIYRKWNVRLCGLYPAQLAEAVADPNAIARHDVRYHPTRDVILADAGTSLIDPYIKGLSADRSTVYERAISA